MDNFCGKRIDGRYEIKEIIGVGGMALEELLTFLDQKEREMDMLGRF